MSKKNRPHRERRVEPEIEQIETAEVEATVPAVVEDDMLPVEIDTLPLEAETSKVVNQIVKSKDVEELKSYVDMFSLNMAKKNALRVAKLQNLLDKVNDQAIERFESHPDEFSNKEILDYMKVVQDQIHTSQQDIEAIGEKPMIQINNQKNEVNINVESGLSRESKTKVLDAVKMLLSQVTAEPIPEESAEEYPEEDEENE